MADVVWGDKYQGAILFTNLVRVGLLVDRGDGKYHFSGRKLLEEMKDLIRAMESVTDDDLDGVDDDGDDETRLAKLMPPEIIQTLDDFDKPYECPGHEWGLAGRLAAATDGSYDAACRNCGISARMYYMPTRYKPHPFPECKFSGAPEQILVCRAGEHRAIFTIPHSLRGKGRHS